MVLVTDGDRSFVLFSYGNIQWSDGANVGFNSGNRSFMLPEALTSAIVDIETTSNVGVPGLYIYRVDQDSIMEPTYNFTSKIYMYINERNYSGVQISLANIQCGCVNVLIPWGQVCATFSSFCEILI